MLLCMTICHGAACYCSGSNVDSPVASTSTKSSLPCLRPRQAPLVYLRSLLYAVVSSIRRGHFQPNPRNRSFQVSQTGLFVARSLAGVTSSRPVHTRLMPMVQSLPRSCKQHASEGRWGQAADACRCGGEWFEVDVNRKQYPAGALLDQQVLSVPLITCSSRWRCGGVLTFGTGRHHRSRSHEALRPPLYCR